MWSTSPPPQCIDCFWLRGMLRKYFVAKNKAQGLGYIQPDGPHKERYIDISSVNILGIFLFLIALIEGLTRVVYHK